MELIIIIVALAAIIIVNLMMKININELKNNALNPELNEITKNYPKNTEICKSILEKLENKTTKIEEDITSEATLYIAIQDKISIGNTHESFTRIQTIAHECLHSIQDKKMLIFNFIYSNIYFIYFFLICILVVIKKLPAEMMFSNILLILSFIYYSIRVFLENDAMIKAEYLAKEYMEEQKISSKEDIEEVCKGFQKINNGVIKGTNGNLFVKIMLKVAFFNVLALIF
ncbi:MAG: hypothetical protein IJE68_04105 [Clostridia bacterium]|nr:hypothetical protein [Clostridia bacterium]